MYSDHLVKRFVVTILMGVLFTGSASARQSDSASAQQIVPALQVPSEQFISSDLHIRGIVENESGEPVEGVHIQVEHTGETVVSQSDGSFQLGQPASRGHAVVDGGYSEEVVLLVSRVGYKAARIPVGRTHQDELITIVLQEAVYESETVVVTATRTRRDLEKVSIPVQVVTGDEIHQTGSLRLSDVLAEQAGMQLVSDHGTGIQVQGFDPEYTLIMIDGNPVIGRTAGTLDLNRISVRNVEQIEIVKGPSSALWGSDALAGVINIITEKSNRPLSGGLTTRYGGNNSLDLAGDLSFRTGSWTNDIFLNRNSTDGYRLNPGSIGQTVPEYENYTLSYRTQLDLSDRIDATVSLRYFTEDQRNNDFYINDEGDQVLLDYAATQEDLVVNPTFTFQPVDRLDITAGLQTSVYRTVTDYTYLDSDDTYDFNDFQQIYNKPELQSSYWWNDQHQSLIGAGAVLERLKADRYPGDPEFTTTFIFAQHSWLPNERFEITGGFRYNAHSEYRSQLSPKLSARYNLTDRLQLRASAGDGFKSPDIRQLFLDFTNAAAGYSVLGASTAAAGMQRLIEEGQIAQVLIPVEQLNKLTAESSRAFNLGVDYDMREDVRLRLNLFRNNVEDMIESAPIARRQNGQAVYSYLNLEKIFTQGVEAEVRWDLFSDLRFTVGYQLLDARRLLEEERNVQDENGEVVTRTLSSYEPMLNRSTHSGTVKLFYENDSGWGATLRGTFRGKYGLFDLNGNGYVDDDEYEDGYMVWNGNFSKRFLNRLRIQGGVDNLLGYTNTNIPYLPGRLWYAQLSIYF